jgi:hypothetical protein
MVTSLPGMKKAVMVIVCLLVAPSVLYSLDKEMPLEGRPNRHYERLVRDHFEKTFHNTCRRFKFIQDYWKMLESPPGQVVEFEFNVKGAKEGDLGGVGDRLGGLISAVAIALRFQRLVVIDADEAFNQYFRPLRNPSIVKAFPRAEVFSYENSSAWAKYTPSNDPRLVNNDMSRCSNPEYHPEFYLNPENIHKCGLDNYKLDDVKDQPIIKIRANRCYLCKWMSNPTDAARSQLIDVLGLSENDNLYEVGGCMLRLVIWPTDYAIAQLAQVIVNYVHPRRNMISTNSTVATVSVKATNVTTGNTVKYPVNRTMQTLFPILNKKLDSSLMKSAALSYRHRQQQSQKQSRPLLDRTGRQLPIPRPFLPFMIGLHFRCGDAFIKDKSSRACEFDPVNLASNSPTVMRSGNPLDTGMCAHIVASRLLQHLTSISNKSSGEIAPLDRSELMFHIASDNVYSAQQMLDYATNQVFARNGYVSPIGCHIDINSTRTCAEETLLHFLLLSMSHIMILPTFDKVPTSGFSRLAAVYGLMNDVNTRVHNNDMKSNVLLSPLDCTGRPTAIHASVTHGNWICDDLYPVMKWYSTTPMGFELTERWYNETNQTHLIPKLREQQQQQQNQQVSKPNRRRRRKHAIVSVLLGLLVFAVVLAVKSVIGAWIVQRTCPSLAPYRKYIMVCMALLWLYLYFLT